MRVILSLITNLLEYPQGHLKFKASKIGENKFKPKFEVPFESFRKSQVPTPCERAIQINQNY